eukprot:Sspe_Gene.92522::Locus_64898_Transcript_1_1_Confidence_1.000_Length_1257::g.92522::m.92522
MAAHGEEDVVFVLVQGPVSIDLLTYSVGSPSPTLLSNFTVYSAAPPLLRGYMEPYVHLKDNLIFTLHFNGVAVTNVSDPSHPRQAAPLFALDVPVPGGFAVERVGDVYYGVVLASKVLFCSLFRRG